MEIELRQIRNGKPVDPSTSSLPIPERIKSLKQSKNYQVLLDASHKMDQSRDKYITAASALLQLRRWDELVQCCNKGLKFGEYSQFYHLKGKAVGKLGDHKQQIELINKAIQMNPQVAAYHRNIGAGYYTCKKYPQAIEHHLKAIELEPSNPINYHNLGSACFRNGQYKRARSYFDQAITRQPEQALSYSWKGDCYRQEQQLKQALECYNKAYDLTHSLVYLKERDKMAALLQNTANSK